MDYKYPSDDENPVKQKDIDKNSEPDQIRILSEAIGFNYDQFAASLKQISAEYTENQTLNIEGIDYLTSYIQSNHQFIIDNAISIKVITDEMQTCHIDDIIMNVLSSSTNDSELQSAIYFIAVISSYPADYFKYILKNTRYYIPIFNLFTNPDVNPPGNFNQNAITSLVNLSPYEQACPDSFEIFSTNFNDVFVNFINAFQFRCASLSSALLFRFFLPIYEKFQDSFEEEHIALLFSLNSEDELTFIYASKLATKILSHYGVLTEETSLHHLLLDFFEFYWMRVNLFSYSGQAISLEMYINLLIYIPNELKISHLKNITQFPLLIKEGLKIDQLDAHCITFIARLAEIFVPDSRNPKSPEIWAFQPILSGFNGSVGTIVELINKRLENLSNSAKINVMEFFNSVAKASAEGAGCIISLVDLDFLAAFLESSTVKQLSLNLDLIETLLNCATRKGLQEARDFVSTLELHGINELMNELEDHEDEMISIRVEKIIQRVNELIGEEQE